MALVSRHGIRPDRLDADPDALLDLRRGFVGYAEKDLGAALALGRDLGLDLPGAELVQRRFAEAMRLSDAGPG
jgi:hypothetical protein